MFRRRTVASLVTIFLVFGINSTVFAAKPVIAVFKDANCGCCTGWIKHLEDSGFAVNATNVADTSAYRKKFQIPATLASCHSAVVSGYAIEGHVPAKDIQRLLKEHPKAIGLAVPGMPSGSPGMDGPNKMAYDVILVKNDGTQSVFHHYAGD
ncbi:DUF411 domain-containing protein [Glaciimonas sp. CA11.2]|uniref:DUF411 domain-containing protein n=1 Tax=Glaciimonas sp. CA11.2 TaxID=3048601 RepID=UPI002AB39626|nr:DUF411 domain-containing protein [Glaciimonas sp. CA11.2]MDY7547092.1 DUF411 domain-containing protein [Glaciimonas sp. CA11.2]MEB0164366.1 DUF411 domain-containing protein [Glaciimonas sp. CA11.2]